LSKKVINIIGGGCAGLSLARFSSVLKKYNFNLFVGLKKDNNKDHFWGFLEKLIFRRCISKC